MQEVELTSARLVRVWWAFAWRFAALWFVLGATLLVAALLSVIALMRMGILTEPHALKMGGNVGRNRVRRRAGCWHYCHPLGPSGSVGRISPGADGQTGRHRIRRSICTGLKPIWQNVIR